MLAQNYGWGPGIAAVLHVFGPIILVLVLWTLFWKGLALWHSGQRGQTWWFVIMLIVNTVGILEIIYLFGVIKLKWSELFSKKSG